MLSMPPLHNPPPGTGLGLIMSAFIYENYVSDGRSRPHLRSSGQRPPLRNGENCTAARPRCGRLRRGPHRGGGPARADLARPHRPCTAHRAHCRWEDRRDGLLILMLVNVVIINNFTNVVARQHGGRRAGAGQQRWGLI